MECINLAIALILDQFAGSNKIGLVYNYCEVVIGRGSGYVGGI